MNAVSTIRRSVLALSVGFSLLFAQGAFAQGVSKSPALRLGVSEAIDMAIKASETVQQRENDVTSSYYKRKEAVSQWLPQVNADAGYNYYPSVQTTSVAIVPGSPAVSVALKKDFDLSTTVSLQQMFYDFGKVHHAINAASHGQRANEWGREAARRDMAYMTAMAYMKVLLAQKVVSIAKGSYDNAVRTRSILDEKYEFGRIPRGDGIKSQADIAARLPVLKEAESDLDLAMRNLKRLTDIPEEQGVSLTDSLVSKFPRYDADKSLNQMFDVEPHLKLIEETITLNTETAKAEKAQYYPTLGMYASYSLFAQSDDPYLGHDEFQNIGNVGLNLSIPIWNGNRTWSRYKQALMQKENSKLELEKVNRDLILELRNAISEYDSLLDTYPASVEAVRLAKESFDAQGDSFRAGSLTLTELNDAELQLTNNRLREALVLFNINQSIARIERLISGEGEKSWETRYLAE